MFNKVFAYTVLITCFEIHIKVGAMRLQHLVGKLPVRGSVCICGQHLDDGLDLVHVLLDRGEIHRLRELWSIIVNVQDLQKHVSPGDQRFSAQISDIDRKPVVRHCLSVQCLCCTNHT